MSYPLPEFRSNTYWLSSCGDFILMLLSLLLLLISLPGLSLSCHVLLHIGFTLYSGAIDLVVVWEALDLYLVPPIPPGFDGTLASHLNWQGLHSFVDGRKYTFCLFSVLSCNQFSCVTIVSSLLASYSHLPSIASCTFRRLATVTFSIFLFSFLFCGCCLLDIHTLCSWFSPTLFRKYIWYYV